MKKFFAEVTVIIDTRQLTAKSFFLKLLLQASVTKSLQGHLVRTTL